MDKEEIQHLVLRQVDDILSQADKILSGADDMETLRNFADYSEELKAFFRKNSDNAMILERVELIPVIQVEEQNSGTLLSMAEDLLGGAYIRDTVRKNQLLEQVRTAREYYSSIQFLYKAEMS